MDSKEAMNPADPVEVKNPVVSAATVKLPTFWIEEPFVWFAQAESQFSLRSISDDDTKYHHVLSAIDQVTAKRIVDLLRSPPVKGSKYSTLKDRLLSTYTLSSYQRGQRLLRVSSLGDRSPSQLMDEMLGHLGSHEPCFLFKCIFLDHLPDDVRAHLVPLLDTSTTRSLALLADKLVSARGAAIQAVASRTSVDDSSRGSNRSAWCRHHRRWGPKAFSCEKPCSFVQRGPKPRGGVNSLLGNEEVDLQ